jgi:hypothetical protein
LRRGQSLTAPDRGNQHRHLHGAEQDQRTGAGVQAYIGETEPGCIEEEHDGAIPATRLARTPLPATPAPTTTSITAPDTSRIPVKLAGSIAALRNASRHNNEFAANARRASRVRSGVMPPNVYGLPEPGNSR